MINFVVNFFTSTSTLQTKLRKARYTFPLLLPNYQPNTRKNTHKVTFSKREKTVLPTSSLPPTSLNPNSPCIWQSFACTGICTLVLIGQPHSQVQTFYRQTVQSTFLPCVGLTVKFLFSHPIVSSLGIVIFALRVSSISLAIGFRCLKQYFYSQIPSY